MSTIPPTLEPTVQQRWEAFVHHWAVHHHVELTDAARAALVRAIPPPAVMAPLVRQPAPPTAPQATLF